MPVQRKPLMPRAAFFFNRISSPVHRFLHFEVTSGLLLLAATIAALYLVNFGFQEAYNHWVHTPIGLEVGQWSLRMSLSHWVNDGLMALFFFVVGMEIKREIIIGELSSKQKAVLPVVAALGGMVAPALIFLAWNPNPPSHAGWGIPMATDIAFAIGMLSLVSRRVPFPLKIFLLALAIVDDLGAVLVIALFYTKQLNADYLIYSFLLLGSIFVLSSANVRQWWAYLLLGVLTWYCVLKSGVHATIAGVALGFLMPIVSFYDLKKIPTHLKELVDILQKELSTPNNVIDHEEKQTLRLLHKYSSGIRSPLEKSIYTLHPWVTFIIMPLFAFVNAGVYVDGSQLSADLISPLALGIIMGLLLGKPIGIMSFSWVAIKLGWTRLPHGVTWLHLWSTSFIAGIGFTMALFISNLALTDSHLNDVAKIGILTASLIAAVLGLVGFLLIKEKRN